MMDLNAIEKRLVAYDSEVKRPLAALHSLGARAALKTRIDVIRVPRTGKVYLAAYSEGMGRGRQWQILLPIDTLTPELPGNGNAVVVTSSCSGEGRHTYAMSRGLVAHYMRDAITKYGEHIAVTRLSELSIELGIYRDPHPHHFQQLIYYFVLGLGSLVRDGSTGMGPAPSFRTWHRSSPRPSRRRRNPRLGTRPPRLVTL